MCEMAPTIYRETKLFIANISLFVAMTNNIRYIGYVLNGVYHVRLPITASRVLIMEKVAK